MQNKNPAISIVIATYNYLESLKRCLASLERQTFRDFEVIIADDGSAPDVGDWLSAYRPFYPLMHLWQEDKGFRKCRILNQALLRARGEYFVFLDADCIEARDFLAQHWKHREKGCYLGGRRVMISRPVAEAVTEKMVRSGLFDHVSLWALRHTLGHRIRYLEEAMRPLYYLRGKNPFSLLGCNFSIHREDIYAVNGFDEDYENRGGGEDTDIATRMNMVGLRMKSVRYLAVQYHLGHESGESKSASEKMFREKCKNITSADAAVNINSALIDRKRLDDVQVREYPAV